MSYCRFAWEGSDVYVYASGTDDEPTWVCCVCILGKEWNYPSPEEMIAHLAEHKKAGHFVPPHVIAALWEDIEGPNEPVRPEPEEMAAARRMLEKEEI